MSEREQATESEIREERQQEIYQAAYDLYRRSPDWVAFFRDVLGLHGIVRRCYRTREALEEFERTETYAEIQQMLKRLRERGAETPASPEPIRVITVRLPMSLHDTLREEAHEHRTSMNKLCISKLLQFIDNGLVPSDIQRGTLRKGSEVDM